MVQEMGWRQSYVVGWGYRRPLEEVAFGGVECDSSFLCVCMSVYYKLEKRYTHQTSLLTQYFWSSISCIGIF